MTPFPINPDSGLFGKGEKKGRRGKVRKEVKKEKGKTTRSEAHINQS